MKVAHTLSIYYIVLVKLLHVCLNLVTVKLACHLSDFNKDSNHMKKLLNYLADHSLVKLIDKLSTKKLETGPFHVTKQHHYNRHRTSGAVFQNSER